MASNYSKEITSAIKAFLDGDDWKYGFNDEEGYFEFGLTLKNKKIRSVQYYIFVYEYDYRVCAVAPISADSENPRMMAAMNEYFCRINYTLRCGDFEMDMSDGEIRFRVFVDCEQITPSMAMISNSIFCTAAMYDRFGPGIADLIYTDISPAAAFEEAVR